MQGDSTVSDSSEIINLAINIFQNVGIKRWIDRIEILKTEQIYFEICKIIFPETIIHLFRLSENSELTAGQKIQGVIDLIAKLIRNDLYHISGEAIAQGKTNHLKNFLQLLQALSNTMITKDRIEVQSAPGNDKSIEYEDEHLNYTVIGMPKEFKQNIYYTEEGSEKTRTEQREQSSGEDSVDGFPIKPKKNKDEGRHSSKKPEAETQPPPRKTPHYSPQRRRVSHKKKEYPQPTPNRDSETKDKQWVELVSQMNETKLQLEKRQIEAQNSQFVQWKRKAAREQRAEVTRIESKANRQKHLINDRIKKRDELLLSLEGEEQAQRAIRDLFRQERQAKRITEVKEKRREEESAEALMDFGPLNQLLERAINHRPRAAAGG